MTNRSRLFAMVTTEHSGAYTDYALASFFAHTPVRSQDRFILIDNNNTYRKRIWEQFPHVELVPNIAPLSFAQNVNQALAQAAEMKADLFFLNNDIIFTPDWATSLFLDAPVILSPTGNQQFQYQTESLVWKNVLDLETFLKHRREFELLVRSLAGRQVQYQDVLVLGFFCVKLPCEVYSAAGQFSTLYGAGGGEDTDYCLRAHLAGFRVQFSLSSYVLHFNQRSTGAVESAEKKSAREKRYRDVFVQQWGETLTRLAIDLEQGVVEAHNLLEAAKAKDFRHIITELMNK